MSDVNGKRTFQFLRNGEGEPAELDWVKGIETARQAISEAMSAKNVAFLLGAGCSSLVRDGKEVGISTMAPLAKEFCGETLAAQATGFYTQAESVEPENPLVGFDNDPFADDPCEPETPLEDVPWRLTSEEIDYLTGMGIDLEEGYNRNLERLMEVLFAQRFVLRASSCATHWPALDLVAGIIKKVQDFLWVRVTDGAFAHGDTAVRDLYERFYKKLVLRDRSLPRPWVFTTNYDHFNEMAMDRLGIPYANGFSGVVERRFNPASFRYALAEQLDVASRKWTAVDAFVYLAKLHGSVTWTEDDHGLFPLKEIWPPADAGRMMIYPTPAKQSSSLGSPYADLFREFQSRIVREAVSKGLHR